MILGDTRHILDAMNSICAVMGRTVQLDLGKITRIDSCGVAMLLACRRRIESAGGTLVLFAVSDAIRPVFEACNVSSLIRASKECPPEERRLP